MFLINKKNHIFKGNHKFIINKYIFLHKYVHNYWHWSVIGAQKKVILRMKPCINDIASITNYYLNKYEKKIIKNCILNLVHPKFQRY